MAEVESIFDELFKAKGGRYTRQNGCLYDQILFGGIANALSYTLGKIQNPPEIFVDFTNSRNFGASVEMHEGVYYIGISYASVEILTQIFNRFMSAPRVLVSLGDVTKEVERSKLYNTSIQTMDNLEVQIEAGDRCEPNCPIRKQIAEFFIVQALSGMALHELAHIVFGHRSYLEKSLIPNSGIEIKIIDRQSFEAQADIHSFEWLIEWIDFTLTQKNFYSKDLRNLFADKERYFLLTLFALSSAMALFFNKEFTIEDLKTKVHPPFPLRLKISNAFAWEQIKRNKLNIDHKIFIKNQQLVEYALAEIKEERLLKLDMSYWGRSEEIDAVMNAIKNNIDELTIKLQPYAYNIYETGPDGKLIESNGN